MDGEPRSWSYLLLGDADEWHLMDCHCCGGHGWHSAATPTEATKRLGLPLLDSR